MKSNMTMITNEMIESLNQAIDQLWGKNKNEQIVNLEKLLSIIENEATYKDLLIKYVKHVQFMEGIDYLSEGRSQDSGELTDEECEQILKLFSE